MNIRNTVSLSIQEAVELLSKIADSLEQKQEFAFDLKGQEVSIEAGQMLEAQMSISPNEFSLVFNWGEGQAAEGDWRQQFDEEVSGGLAVDKQFHEPPKMVREVNLPDEQPVSAKQTYEDVAPSSTMIRRALPDRMVLNTTTLPLEGGFWTSGFAKNGDVQWSPININSELENRKWADDKVTSLADITPSSAKPKKKRSRKKDDDDLFSELDNLDQKKSKGRSSDEGIERVSIPDRTSARPAGSIPSPGSIPRANVPKATSANIPKATSSGIPKATPKTSSRAEETWQEPKAEDNSTEDSWVKPSQILQKKNQKRAPASDVPETGSKRQSIPMPNSDQFGGSSGSSDPAKKEIDEIRGWKEPTPEENITEDDWVRPSEFLKRAGDGDDDDEDPVNRPPPTAPDAKKKDDDKKKGWASW